VRTDRRTLVTMGATGSVLYRVLAQTLVDGGILAAPTIRMTVCRQEGTWSKYQYRAAEQTLIIRSRLRNRLVVEAAAQAMKPALVFVQKLQHGRHLADMMRGKGLRVEFVWGAKDSDARVRALAKLVAGKLDAIVCSAIFTSGIDIPSLAAVVVAGGGASQIAAIQRIGRGTRNTTDKGTFEVWDVLDLNSEWMERHARTRKNAYEQEGYVVEVLDPEPLALIRSPGRTAPDDGLFPSMDPRSNR